MQTPAAEPKILKKGVALHPNDIADVERIRAHFELDSFSQALRRAVRIAIRSIDEDGAKPRSAA